jgi:tetratricopeptide (TPR) repeat protein
LAALFVATVHPLPAQARVTADSARRAIAAGDAAWTSGARDSAYASYRLALAQSREVSSHVLLRLATLESERNRLDPSIALLREYVRREPSDDEGRLALARVLAWRGRFDQSIAVYDDVLTRDSAYRDAVLGRAQALAWAGRFPAAVAAYERWLTHSPADTAAELGLARALSWAGSLVAAESRYAGVADRGGSADAERGVARVAGWRGDLTRSERLWRALTERYPADAESWLGLAQVQRWAGQTRAADTSLRRALVLAPSSVEALEALQSVRVDLAGAAEPLGTHFTDSDGNRMNTLTVAVISRRVGTARLRLTAAMREADYLGTTGSSTGIRAGLLWSSPGDRIATTTELGATHLSSRSAQRDATAHVRPWAVLRLASRFSTRVAGGVTFSAVPFDETATLIGGGIHTMGLESDMSLTLPGHLSLGVGGGRTTINGGLLPNVRRAVGATARWGGWAELSIAVTARGMAYDTTGHIDGYFAPHRFTLVESSVRKVFGRDRGWGATLEGAVGRQGIRFASGDQTSGSLASRGSVVLRYSPLAGYQVEAAGGASSVASPFAQGAAGYSMTWFSLGGRIKVF